MATNTPNANITFDVEKLTQPMAISVGNLTYLGTLKKEGDVISVVDAVPVDASSGIHSGHLSIYCEEALKGGLTTVELHGMTQVSSQQLSPDLSLAWEISILKLKRALVAGPVNAVISAFKGS